MVKKKQLLFTIQLFTDNSVNRELDGMPGATVSYTNEAPEHNYRVGFPLGFKKVKISFTTSAKTKKTKIKHLLLG